MLGTPTFETNRVCLCISQAKREQPDKPKFVPPCRQNRKQSLLVVAAFAVCIQAVMHAFVSKLPRMHYGLNAHGSLLHAKNGTPYGVPLKITILDYASATSFIEKLIRPILSLPKQTTVTTSPNVRTSSTWLILSLEILEM